MHMYVYVRTYICVHGYICTNVHACLHAFVVKNFAFYTTVAQHVLTELDVGTMIQFGDPVKYGVIKRIEALAGVKSAEIEMVRKLFKFYIYTDFGYYECIFLCVQYV